MDKFITWALQGCMSVALGAGAWYADAMGDKVEALAQQVSELRTEAAVQRVLVQQFDRLEARVTRLEDRTSAPPR